MIMRAMEKFCQVTNHQDHPIAFICKNPKCQKLRLLCLKCSESEHKECFNHLLDIQDIYKLSLSDNLNWINSRSIRKAIPIIRKYDDQRDFESQVLKTVKDVVEEECIRITKYFTQKLEETKEKILLRAKKRLIEEVDSIKQFQNEIKHLYNFDALINIFESSIAGEKDPLATSRELGAFFNQVNTMEKEIEGLQDKALSINRLIDDLREINTEALEDFKKSLSFDFEIFYDGCPSAERWTWDPEDKSGEIKLSENDMVAYKKAYFSPSKVAVVGNMEMFSDYYRWEIDLAGSKPHLPCFVNNFGGKNTIFGIIESSDDLDVENPPLDDVVGLCLNGTVFNMEEVARLENYRNKKYTLDLDLVKGTFTISNGGVIICRKIVGIKGKCFLPIVVFYCVHDQVTLRLEE